MAIKCRRKIKMLSALFALEGQTSSVLEVYLTKIWNVRGNTDISLKIAQQVYVLLSISLNARKSEYYVKAQCARLFFTYHCLTNLDSYIKGTNLLPIVRNKIVFTLGFPRDKSI